MKAVAYTAFGGPEVTQLIDLPKPVPGPTEILVRTAGAGFNPLDKWQRAGTFNMIYPQSAPVVAGNELSGTIEAVGDSVTRFKTGDPVIARVDKARMAAFGEYSVQEEALAAHAPKHMPLVDAAGLPLAGLTAKQVLDRLDVKAGDRVLITGGSGGVGLFAIQLAKLRGATVVTTAGSGADLVREVGADEVVDYRTTKLSTLAKFSKVFDAAGFQDGDEAMADLFSAVETGGTVVSIAGPATPGTFDSVLSWWKYYIVNFVLGRKSAKTFAAATAAGIHYHYLFMRPDGVELQELAGLVDAAKLRVVIDSRFPTDRFADGFARLESHRAKGKVILSFEPGAETTAPAGGAPVPAAAPPPTGSA